MSVLIKGLRMPTEDEIIIRIQPNGAILDRCGHRLIQKAIPIPKHGRLIDADALEKRFEKLPVQEKWYYIELYHAPTIIKAEEGET